jgi:ribosomal protein S18 acetylase RimI-like enzyme
MMPAQDNAKFAIRKAEASDASGILQCLHEAFEPFRTRYSQEGFRDTVLTPETIRLRLSSMSIFVAVAADDQIVGTIACSIVKPGEGHLRGMAVLPAWQGRGVAERLLQSAEDDLASRHCTRVTLDTTEPLERAVRFYEKHGYRATDTISDFFGMPLHEYAKDLRQEGTA